MLRQIRLHPRIDHPISKRNHKKGKHKSKTCTQEALVNTGTLNLKKSQEFALGGGVTFNILAISGDWNARGALIFT